MPFCRKCGNDIENNDLYCPVCGEPNKLIAKAKTAVTDNSNNLRSHTLVSESGSYGLNVKNLLVGTTLENGRYTILEKLGAGGFGVVYKASDANYDGELKALKVIYSENYSDRLVMHKLKTEAKNMIKINHPNVVRLYDVHFDGEIKFLDMEFVDGGDLVDLMLNCPENKVSENKVWELAKQIAQGMQAIHQVNLIHQDLKPENILLTKSGVVKITDFGISESFRSSKSRIEESDIKGTYIYASPEQLVGKNVGKEADVWSFGSTLYHILTGETLYSGIQSSEIILQIDRREFEEIPDISSKMNRMLSLSLKRNFLERFNDFEHLLGFINNNAETENYYNIETTKVTSNIKMNNGSYLENSMIFVAGGVFLMGSNCGKSVESPVHEVELSDFYIGKYPVTQEEWIDIMGSNPSRFQKGRRTESAFIFGWEILGETLKHPVESISWTEAIEFCNRKSVRDELEPVYSGPSGNPICDFNKNGYRLPTEAEWEFAARGGNHSKGFVYSGGTNIDFVAWYKENSKNSTQQVGLKKPNELGIFDMSGNVYEWCWDLFKPYHKKSVKNPKGHKSIFINCPIVVRGGCWQKHDSSCLVSSRFNFLRRGGILKSSKSYIGLRLASSAKQTKIS